MLCNKSSPHSRLLCVAHFTAIENCFRHTAHFTSLSFVRFHPILQQQSWLYLFTFIYPTLEHKDAHAARLRNSVEVWRQRRRHNMKSLSFPAPSTLCCISLEGKFEYVLFFCLKFRSRKFTLNTINSYCIEFTTVHFVSALFFSHSINFQMIKKCG